MTRLSAWVTLPITLTMAMAAGWAVLAQSPPDLQPRLIDKPVRAGPADEQSKRPKLREPPRAPAVPDGAMSTPPASSPPASVPR